MGYNEIVMGYNEAYSELQKEYARQYYQKNREKINARRREKYRKDLEESRRLAKKRQSEFRKANPKYYRRKYYKSKKKPDWVKKPIWWRKEFVNRYKEMVGCEECGGRYKGYVLDLHHIDPGQKSFTVSACNVNRKHELIRQEIKKCEVLCANCHRELHYNA